MKKILIPLFFLVTLFSSCLSGMVAGKMADSHSSFNVSKYIYNNIGVPIEYEYASDVCFYVKNDGTKVSFQPTNSMERTNGYLLSYKFKIEGTKYQYSEVKGYLYKGVYYERIRLVRTNTNESTYGKRIVHGKKINVYVSEIDGAIGTISGNQFYIQQGENGELQSLTSEDDIKKIMMDCPLSIDIINKGASELQKTEGRSNYLNKAIRTYNNDCKPL